MRICRAFSTRSKRASIILSMVAGGDAVLVDNRSDPAGELQTPAGKLLSVGLSLSRFGPQIHSMSNWERLRVLVSIGELAFYEKRE
jgi:hypothetical protein